MNKLIHAPEYYDDHADRSGLSARRDATCAVFARHALPVARLLSPSKRNLGIAEPYFFDNTKLFHIYASDRQSGSERYTRRLTADKYGIRPGGSDMDVFCNENAREVMLAMYRPTFDETRERIMLVADTMTAGQVASGVKVIEQTIDSSGNVSAKNCLQLSDCSLADQAKLYALGNKIIDTMVEFVERGSADGNPYVRVDIT